MMDVIADLAFRLPVTVIGEMLGLPPEDLDKNLEWADKMGRGLDPLQTQETVAGANAAVLALTKYIRGKVAERRRRPGEDLLSALIVAQEGGRRLTEPEVVSTVNLLLLGGQQTTRDLIGNGILALLRHQEQLVKLRDDPSLIRNAVEELLRFDCPVQMTPRWAREDVDIGEFTIAAGDQVTVLLGAANRDPDQFSNPDVLDLERRGLHALLSFGGGAHFCLGAALARAEAQIAISALVRLPQLELASTKLAWREQIALRGLAALAVSFRPGGPSGGTSPPGGVICR